MFACNLCQEHREKLTNYFKDLLVKSQKLFLNKIKTSFFSCVRFISWKRFHLAFFFGNPTNQWARKVLRTSIKIKHF